MESYLFVPPIYTAPAKEINVEVDYGMRDCAGLYTRCKYSFSVYALRTSQKIGPLRHLTNITSYVLVANIGEMPIGKGDQEFRARFKIDMKEQSRLHLMFKNSGACVYVKSLMMYYATCEFRKRLLQFPITALPNSTIGLETVSGTCVQNAVDKNHGKITMTCSSKGKVTSVTGRCICDAGFTKDSKANSCLRKHTLLPHMIFYIFLLWFFAIFCFHFAGVKQKNVPTV